MACVKVLLGKSTIIPYSIAPPFQNSAQDKKDLIPILFMINFSAHAGMDINLPDVHGYTPLGAATIHGRVDVVRTLLARQGTRVNYR